ncbi:MAG TPA: tetratricopeptide repeat protein [Anaeromyxobacteraceae bacterium]|nr:tetratricopeptide repeat protein [Anaeromyxobacteraceae bacterium]
MSFSRKAGLLGLLLAAACAAGGAGGGRPSSDRYKQADYRPPQPQEIDSDAERAEYQDAITHIAKARDLQTSGDVERSRAEFRQGGAMLAGLGEKYTQSEWRIVYRRSGAEYLLQGGDYAGAAKAAEGIRQDPEATPASLALGARIAAGSWQSLANAESKAGRIEPLRLLSASQRKGEAPKPRTPPDPWKRFIDAADSYVQSYKADPDPRATSYAPTLAFIAAQVQFAYDNMEEAARRFDLVLTQFPTSEQAPDAAQLYLQTFLVRNDQAGYKQGLDHVSQVVEKAMADAKASNDPAAKARAEQLAKVQEQVQSDQRQFGFVEATTLLNSGKEAEAAAAFEKYVQDNPQSTDAPSALYNAGIAWDRAGQPKKAEAVREKLFTSYPDSKVAGPAMLAMASSRAKANDHAGAADLYRRYIEKFPQGENRCLAMLNIGIEYDQANKSAEAAKRYLDFANDPKCTAEDADNTATLLFRAATFFEKSKKPAEYKAALQKLAAMTNVKGPVPQSYVAEAKNRLKKMR